MLDDNLRVLGRRINDLELENAEKKERLTKTEMDYKIL